MCHGSVPSRPMTPFCARATTRVIGGFSMQLLWRCRERLPSTLLRVAMTNAVAELIEQAGQQLGPKAVITDPKAIEPWVTDWRGRVHGAAAAMLAPASTDEVVTIVKLAAAHRVPLVPQGGNTGMSAGATPPPDGTALLLSMRRMNRIRSISADDRLAVAEPGWCSRRCTRQRTRWVCAFR